MRNILYTVSIAYLLAYAGCTHGTKAPIQEISKIEYGANDGKYFKILGKRIYYEEYGKGVPLILLSGGGLSRSIKDYEKVIPPLSQHYRVIAPDSPGQGRSEQADTLTYPILLDFMTQFIDSLSIDSAYVMGWSDGGIMAILLSENRSKILRKAIAVGANNGLRDAMADGVYPYPMKLEQFEKINKEEIDTYSKMTGRDWKKQVSDLNGMVFQQSNYFSDSIYGKIKIPLMIVLGDRDVISAEHGLKMHRAIKGSQFCVLPNTSHEVFSESPELISKIAIDFFNQ